MVKELKEVSVAVDIDSEGKKMVEREANMVAFGFRSRIGT